MTGDAEAAVPRPRLRFGVIIDRDTISRWQLAVVRALIDGGDAELALVVKADDPAVVSPSRRERYSLWRLYNNGVVARRARSVARAGTWDDVARGVRRLEIRVERRGKWSQHVGEADLAEIRSADLDFIVRFGLGIVRGGILEAARYGVWSFHHDDERVIRGGPPSFWELYDGLPTTGVLFQRLTDRLDGGVPLARATFRSILHSYPRNRDRTLLGAATLPAQVARAIRLGLLDASALPVSASSAAVRHNPTDREMLRFFALQSWRAIAVRSRGVLKADVWAVGVAAAGTVGAGDVRLDDIEWIPELKRSGYLADPFVVTHAGRTAILVEEFDESSNRGVISALLREPEGWRLHSAVLDPGVHASYPCTIADGGELYCVPETWQAGRVEIWRAVEFPTRWERAGILIAGVAVVDPTPFRHEGRWWLLGTIKDDEPDAKLHAWSAPELLGPWLPHPLNPLKIDVGSSRPAGAPFVVGGVLYRPAQDCSASYGGGVVLNRVVALDDAGLVEEPAGRVVLSGGRYSSGVHTLTASGALWVVDGRRYGINPHRMGREARARLAAIGRRGSR